MSNETEPIFKPGEEPNRKEAERIASNILGNFPAKYSDAGRQIMVALDAKDKLIREAQAESANTRDLVDQNGVIYRKKIASLEAEIKRLKGEKL